MRNTNSEEDIEIFALYCLILNLLQSNLDSKFTFSFVTCKSSHLL